MERIESGIISYNSQINTVLQKVILIKNQIEIINDIKQSNLSIPETIKATRIEPREPTDSLERKASDRCEKKKPYVLKKSYKIIDVVCISITMPEDDA